MYEVDPVITHDVENLGNWLCSTPVFPAKAAKAWTRSSMPLWRNLPPAALKAGRDGLVSPLSAKERIRLLIPFEIGDISGMSKQQLVESKREQILAIARKHGAVSVRLFGSTARGEEAEMSDVDFVVELEPGRSLLDLGGLQSDLERLLGCAVDVVTVSGLRERIRARVLAEAIPI